MHRRKLRRPEPVQAPSSTVQQSTAIRNEELRDEFTAPNVNSRRAAAPGDLLALLMGEPDSAEAHRSSVEPQSTQYDGQHKRIAKQVIARSQSRAGARARRPPTQLARSKSRG